MKFLIYVSTFLFALNTFAGGDQGGGGGDPRAQAAVDYAKGAAAWLLTNPHPDIDINVKRLIENIDRVSRSLDTKNPLLRFVQAETINCFNVPKPGCTNSDMSIDLASAYWDNPDRTEKDKCVLSTIEFSRPQRIVNLYEKASTVCKILYPAEVKTLSNKNWQMQHILGDWDFPNLGTGYIVRIQQQTGGSVKIYFCDRNIYLRSKNCFNANPTVYSYGYDIDAFYITRSNGRGTPCDYSLQVSFQYPNQIVHSLKCNAEGFEELREGTKIP